MAWKLAYESRETTITPLKTCPETTRRLRSTPLRSYKVLLSITAVWVGRQCWTRSVFLNSWCQKSHTIVILLDFNAAVYSSNHLPIEKSLKELITVLKLLLDFIPWRLLTAWLNAVSYKPLARLSFHHERERDFCCKINGSRCVSSAGSFIQPNLIFKEIIRMIRWHFTF